ncbi:MAG: 1-deoxy-D-xylulose-5-phosphate synthase [Planctomycetota bacterium]|jgi:1-deoxy-D-xylulose-5-phosphate synthase
MGEFLDQIGGPEDLKELSVEQLKSLADEIREFIIASVSRTGGHLASNLGVVELTLALHSVFDFKRDKLLWDVGHQCYAHKILTGRKEGFEQLRKGGGLSGFPDPTESEYDQFVVGHAGTAVATAIGMALGQYHQGKQDKIVAVVGDASIVNGVSFEALNNLGLVKRQLLIVLNDNSMAIDPTQGAVAKYFSRVRLSHTYEDIRKTTSNILEHLPLIGKGVEEVIERIKKSIRMVLPASQMFESLNIPYFGPVDGYDIGSLMKLFGGLSHLEHPAILHVYTKKGKGFVPAERDGRKYHSTGPFKINGELAGASPESKSFTSVFGERLTELAAKDDRIVAITSAMCDGTGLGEFRKRFGERFYDVGIAEGAAVDMAAGLARSGLRPVVCIYSTFLQRSFDQICQEVALQNLGVVFCVDRAGMVGSDGPTHHGVMDIGFLRMMPNMVLTAPANEVEVKLALEFALGAERPVAIRYPKDMAAGRDLAAAGCGEPFRLGKSIFVKRAKGSSIAIVSYGSVLRESLEAAGLLEAEGIGVDVVNARFAAPIDGGIVSLLSEVKCMITVEDHRLACGFGSAVLEQACSSMKGGIERPVAVLGAATSVIRHDRRDVQLNEAGISVDNIVATAKRMLRSSNARLGSLAGGDSLVR